MKLINILFIFLLCASCNNLKTSFVIEKNSSSNIVKEINGIYFTSLNWCNDIFNNNNKQLWISAGVSMIAICGLLGVCYYTAKFSKNYPKKFNTRLQMLDDYLENNHRLIKPWIMGYINRCRDLDEHGSYKDESSYWNDFYAQNLLLNDTEFNNLKNHINNISNGYGVFKDFFEKYRGKGQFIEWNDCCRNEGHPEYKKLKAFLANKVRQEDQACRSSTGSLYRKGLEYIEVITILNYLNNTKNNDERKYLEELRDKYNRYYRQLEYNYYRKFESYTESSSLQDTINYKVFYSLAKAWGKTYYSALGLNNSQILGLQSNIELQYDNDNQSHNQVSE